MTNYEKIALNVIKILQKEEEENNESVHTTDEWLELLQGDLKDGQEGTNEAD